MSAGGSTAMTALELLKVKQQEAYDLALEKHLAAGGDESNFDKDNRTAATDLYNLADPKNELKRLRDAAEFQRKRDVERLANERAEKRQVRKMKRGHGTSAVIPWKLLDALEGEKRAWEGERTFLEFNKSKAAAKRGKTGPS